MLHVSSRTGVATLRTAIHWLLTYLLTYLLPCTQYRIDAGETERRATVQVATGPRRSADDDQVARRVGTSVREGCR